MNKKKIVCLAMAACVAGSVAAAGCGGGGNGTRVTFWANCNDVELAVFQQITKEFNKKHYGDIEVKLVSKPGDQYGDTLGLTLSGSKAPDVFYVGDNGYKQYAEDGLLYDITDFIDASETYKIEDMWSDVAVRYRYDINTRLTNTPEGRYYGVPKDIGPTVIYYNETLFKGAGITVLSVDEAGLEAFNNGGKDDRGNTKADLGLDGVTVKERGFFTAKNKYYFNNQIPMSWQETNDCATLVQKYMREDLKDKNGYGYFTEWWFNYGWTVGGDCIQQIPTDNPDYTGYYYDFTLMENTTNYIVADDCPTVKVNGKDYYAGQIIEYADKIDMSGYPSDPAGGASRKDTYTVTAEVERLADEGKLNRLPSQRAAFTEFVRLGTNSNVVVDKVDGVELKGYNITPRPDEIGGDSGKTTSFMNGHLAMLVDLRYITATFRNEMDNEYEWDVAPLPMYKEYDSEGNITVHGIEAGHSGSVALCISKKSKVAEEAWKFIEYCASEEGQTLQAEAGFAIPLQRDLANSPVFLDGENPKNAKIFIDAAEYETAADWWYLKDKKWIDTWANVLNGSVRNGKLTMTQFYNGEDDLHAYTNTFDLLLDYCKK